ncbi:MAG: SDR family oxidoreductase [Sediminicola sp.]
MQNQVKGKVVVITGASSGIGKAMATTLARNGAKIVLGARRREGLEKIVEEIRNEGGQAIYAVTDVKDKAQLVSLVDLAVETYGKLDVMVNNAGVCQLGRVDDLDIAGWDEMIDINLKGVLYGMAAAIPVFKKLRSGHIVNIISTSGIQISPMQAVYAGTKNAVRTISEAFRQESGGTIRITGISPGFVKTAFVDNINNQQMKTVILERMEQFGISPEAVADTVMYAIGQPEDVEVGDIVIRPSAQN